MPYWVPSSSFIISSMLITDGIEGALGTSTVYRTPKPEGMRHFYQFRLQ